MRASAADGEDLWIMIVVMLLLLLMLFDGMLPAFANDVATRRQTARSKRCQLLPSFDPSSTIPPPSTHCISTSSLHVASGFAAFAQKPALDCLVWRYCTL